MTQSVGDLYLSLHSMDVKKSQIFWKKFKNLRFCNQAPEFLEVLVVPFFPWHSLVFHVILECFLELHGTFWRFLVVWEQLLVLAISFYSLTLLGIPWHFLVVRTRNWSLGFCLQSYLHYLIVTYFLSGHIGLVLFFPVW